LVQPTTQQSRVTQYVIENLVKPTTQKSRVTQYVIEVLGNTEAPPAPEGRVYGPPVQIM
jgi:hypothetical protein